MSILNNPAPLSSSGELKNNQLQEEIKQTDPKAACVSILSKLSQPAEDPKSSKPLEHDTNEEEQRKALMAMC